MGTIVLYHGAKTPEGWMDCDGRLLPIPHYQSLFGLLGNEYGGNGINNFAIPDMPREGNTRYIICIEGDYPHRN